MVTDSQRYRSTRGGEENLSFSEVVLKGLAADGGLFLPHAVPKADWVCESEIGPGNILTIP
jgi:threonine synthase